MLFPLMQPVVQNDDIETNMIFVEQNTRTGRSIPDLQRISDLHSNEQEGFSARDIMTKNTYNVSIETHNVRIDQTLYVR